MIIDYENLATAVAQGILQGGVMLMLVKTSCDLIGKLVPKLIHHFRLKRMLKKYAGDLESKKPGEAMNIFSKTYFGPNEREVEK